MKKPIVIFGAGGFAREVLDLLRDVNDEEPTWEVLGFIDDDPARWGTSLNDAPVLGGREWLSTCTQKPHMVLGIGSPVAKMRVSTALRDSVASFPSLVHPTTVCSKYVQIGEGVVITAMNVLTNRIMVGDFAMLNLACTLGHDCSIGSYATLSPGVNVSGYVRIGDGCDLGTGVKLIPSVSVGNWSVIGAGSVVVRDLPDVCTAVGVPAKVVKQREPNWYINE